MTDLPAALGVFLGLQTVAIVVLGVKVWDLKFWQKYMNGKLEMYGRHCSERHMETFKRLFDSDPKEVGRLGAERITKK